MAQRYGELDGEGRILAYLTFIGNNLDELTRYLIEDNQLTCCDKQQQLLKSRRIRYVFRTVTYIGALFYLTHINGHLPPLLQFAAFNLYPS
jgi:hypothetical protein